MLFDRFNGTVDPSTGNVLPSYDWQADAKNWPTEIIWQVLTSMIFDKRMFIPWQEIWAGKIWSSETVRRRIQEFREQGRYLPTKGPVFERIETAKARQANKKDKIMDSIVHG